jgi:hypothetical protein
VYKRQEWIQGLARLEDVRGLASRLHAVATNAGD